MNFGFAKLQEILAQWPMLEVSQETASDSLMERIRQVLLKFSFEGKLQKSDLQPLLRHLLLRESINSSHEKNLRIPAASDWPTALEWNSHGVSAMNVGSDAFLLTALPWYPEWLGVGESGAFADSFSDKVVREEGLCSADPFISDVTGYTHYSSPGQREAIRAAFLIPPGDTLIVNLPTGSGKSLVGQAPALVHRQDGNLTLFVVPTVALAIDQARQMEKYFRSFGNNTQTWPLAWYGGVSEEDRSEIRRRMREGTQRILFTSPEALTTSLLRTVFEVARNGMLRYLVIDEAHLITQWGDEFRPAFQALAGLRNSLLRNVEEEKVESFRTLLLSATFTPETIDTLANLFGPPSRVQMVAAVHLRPEPQYWFSRANSSVEKQEQVLEALRNAPRPFILYVTKRNDAIFWSNLLKNYAGYHRVERFDGDTPDQKRKEIITAWIENKLDGVVATSAFGVGIDKGDVRTVIHATIPETLDRFYQEVGRGGRDGKSSVSLLVYEDADWTLSKSMANPTIISNELGISRWRALHESRKKYDREGDLFRVDPDAVRQGLTGSNDENVKWNMRTLLLMSRAGFLELDVEPNSVPEGDADDLESSSPLATMAIVRIRLLRTDHLLPRAWDEAISLSRSNTLNGGVRNLRLMQGLLQGGSEVAETLAELYRNNSERWPVVVTLVCGGCPSDRFGDKRRGRYHIPVAAPVYNLPQLDLVHWKSTFPYLNDPRYIAVFYEPETTSLAIVRFIKWLVSTCGVQEVCASDTSALLGLPDWRQLYRQAPSGVVVHRNLWQMDEEPYSPLARVTFFDASVTAKEMDQVLLMQRPMHLVFYPSDTRDPNHPLRLFSDTAINSVRFDQLNVVINQ
jgi:superfamily II DNA helicase RecQ